MKFYDELFFLVRPGNLKVNGKSVAPNRLTRNVGSSNCRNLLFEHVSDLNGGLGGKQSHESARRRTGKQFFLVPLSASCAKGDENAGDDCPPEQVGEVLQQVEHLRQIEHSFSPVSEDGPNLWTGQRVKMYR